MEYIHMENKYTYTSPHPPRKYRVLSFYFSLKWKYFARE
mgnify:CR=1 FL=1